MWLNWRYHIRPCSKGLQPARSVSKIHQVFVSISEGLATGLSANSET